MYWFAIFILVFGETSVRADLIWVKGKPNPMSGRIVASLTGTDKIEFRSFRNGSFERKQSFAASEIEFLVRNIDSTRLESLSPKRPNEYREYAEELAVQKNDMAARQLARRLYLLAAAHSTEDLRRSSLLGLIAIAESAEEYERLKMLHVLSDPESGDANELSETRYGMGSKQNENSRSAKSDFSETEKARMLELIYAIRRENSSKSKRLLDDDGNHEIFQKWKAYCSLAELKRIASAQRPSKVQLAKLLSIEIQILNSDTTVIARPVRSKAWSDHASRPSSTIGVLPTFENVTRFNPKQSVYRNGRWEEP